MKYADDLDDLKQDLIVKIATHQNRKTRALPDFKGISRGDFNGDYRKGSLYLFDLEDSKLVPEKVAIEEICNLNKAGVFISVFTYQKTRSAFFKMYVAHALGMNSDKVFHFNSSTSEIELSNKEAKEIKYFLCDERFNFGINDVHTKNEFDTIEFLIEEEVREHGSQIIIIDSFSYIHERELRLDRDTELNHIAQKFKHLAKKHNIVIIGYDERYSLDSVQEGDNVVKTILADKRD